MRLLGIIRNIGEARQWTTSTGPVTIYPLVFEAEGNTFIGDMFASAQYITNRGICKGAVGYFTLEFKPKDVKNKDGVVLFQRQDVRFKDFQLANANLVGEQSPATEDKPQEVDLTQVPGQPVEGAQPAEPSEEVQINPVTGMPF